MKRKWIRRAAVGLFVLTLVTAAGVLAEWHFTRWRNEQRLSQATARLDADDPAWRLHDLVDDRNARLPPAERNAGDQILRALALAPPSFAQWKKNETHSAAPVSNRLLDPEDARAVAAVHAGCAEALAVARRVRDLPKGGFATRVAEPNPLDTPLAQTQKAREGAYLLALDALVTAYDRRPADALAACHAMLNVASGAVGDEPTLISQLVRIAVTVLAVNEVERTLAWNEVAAGPLTELQERLAAERDVPRLLHGYRGDRAMFFHAFANVDAGLLAVDLKPVGSSSVGAAERLQFAYARKLAPKAQSYLLAHFDALIASAALPDPARRAAQQAAMDAVPRPGGMPSAEGFAAMFLPASQKVDAAESRVRARVGCAVVALACERFRLRAGRWPATLGELPADLLAAVPQDPYTGAPLLYLVDDDGATVYAAGPDRTDDGGLIDNRNDEPGIDLGFRLWNPTLRPAAPHPRSDGPGE